MNMELERKKENIFILKPKKKKKSNQNSGHSSKQYTKTYKFKNIKIIQTNY